MALTLQQVQKKAMARKAKEVQAKIEQAAQFGQPMLMGATDDVTGEEGRDPVGLADGGMVINDRVAQTRGIKLGSTDGVTPQGILFRPEAAMTPVSNDDLIGMAGKNTTPSVFGGSQPTALPAPAPVQASPNITFGATSAPVPPPVATAPSAVPGPTPEQAAGIAQTLRQFPAPTRRPRMAVTENPVIKANIKFADGGLVGNASGALKNRGKQLDEQEAKALAPPKEEKPMPKVEKKPEEKPRSFLETAKKAVFGFKDGGRVGCADGGIINSIKSSVQTNPVYMAADALRDGVRAAAGNIPQGLAVTAAPILFGARALLGSKDAGAGSDLYPDPRTIPGAVDISARGKGFSNGGLVRGPGTGTSDSVKAKGPNGEEIRLSDGEVVLPADTVQQLGVKNLENVIDQTHTPVKAKFGNGFVNGKNWTMDYQPIEYNPQALELEQLQENMRTRAAPPPEVEPPRLSAANRNPSFANGESREARAAREAMRGGGTQRLPSRAALGAPPAHPLLAAPPEPPPSFGARAGEAASKAWNSAKGVWETIRSAPPAGSAAAKAAEPTRLGNAARAVGGRMVRPLSALDLWSYSGDANAPTMGQHGEIMSTQAATQLNQTDPGYLRTTLGSTNSAPTDALLRELNTLQAGTAQTPEQQARIAQIRGYFTQKPKENKPNPLQFGTITTPAVPSTKTPSGELMGPPSDLATPPDPLKTWQAQALAGMGAGPGSGYQARPDLGAPGEQWMRRGNSYVGVGNGPQKGNGIDFGFSRPSMQAAIAASGNSGYPEAPTYQENPAVSRLQSQIEQTAERLAQIKPGEVGGRALTNKLTALQGAMAALQAPSAAVNAFNQAAHKDEVSKFGAAQTARAQDATNRLEREKAGYAFAKDTAAARNAAATHKDAQDQIRLTNSNELLKAAAGEDKKKASSLLAAAGFRNFKGADGKTYKFHELNAEDRANNMGILENMAANIATNQEAGKAVSWADADVVGEATGPGFIKALVQDPVGVTLHGTRQLNGNWSTAGTNRPPSHEAALAQLKQHAAAREYNSSMRRTPEARAAALRALVLAGNDPELAERALAK